MPSESGTSSAIERLMARYDKIMTEQNGPERTPVQTPKTCGGTNGGSGEHGDEPTPVQTPETFEQTIGGSGARREGETPVQTPNNLGKNLGQRGSRRDVETPGRTPENNGQNRWRVGPAAARRRTETRPGTGATEAAALVPSGSRVAL